MERRSSSRSVMDLTMTAREPGTVNSTSRFHLGTRCGGPSTRILLKPAMCAAAAAMKVLPVPISPTTVVPRWAYVKRWSWLLLTLLPRGPRSDPLWAPSSCRGRTDCVGRPSTVSSATEGCR